MKNILRKSYSIISIMFVILTIIEMVMFFINPDYIYRYINIVYSIFISYYLIRSSGLYNKINIKYLSILGIIISIVGLLLVIYLDDLFIYLFGYENVFDKYSKFYLTISYFKGTIYVVFLIVSVLNILYKEKKPKFRQKMSKRV